MACQEFFTPCPIPVRLHWVITSTETATTGAGEPTHSIRVLLIDDDEELTELSREFLRRDGMEVSVV